MRSEEQMFSLILSVAEADESVRAVILNGSRANKKVKRDTFQDYDIIYVVKELDSYYQKPNWIDVFGERIIMQMPNEMQLEELVGEVVEDRITYLMLFKDYNRIDLSLVPLNKKEDLKDSLSIILLDKDQVLPTFAEASDKDYWIKKPSEKDFLDCCNEFWWVSTYVVKGLARKEPLYAKAMLDVPVRNMFLKMLSWQVGLKNGFHINLGSSYRFLENYLEADLWEGLLLTYSDAQLENIGNSLRSMTKQFHEQAQFIAFQFNFSYNLKEAEEVINYLEIRV